MKIVPSWKPPPKIKKYKAPKGVRYKKVFGAYKESKVCEELYQIPDNP